MMLPLGIEIAGLSNVEAEAALLGAMMLDNRVIEPVADTVTAEDFSEPAFAAIFTAALREVSQGRTANPVTLRPIFEGSELLGPVGGPAFLAQLTGSGAALIGWREFANQIRSLAERRRLVLGLAEALQLAGDHSADLQQLADVADAAIVRATTKGEGSRNASAAECLDEVIAGFDAPIEGVTCGRIEPVDQLLGHLRPSQMIIGAGRPGMGKTAFAISYALGAASQGHGVLFISLEMSRAELGQRIAADLCFDGERGVPFKGIRTRTLTPPQRREVCRAREAIQGMPLQIIDAGQMTISSLRMRVRRWKRRMAAKGQKLELVVVDYLQLLSADSRTRSNYEAVSEISRGIKLLAKDEEVAILALAQLSREVERRSDKRPLLSDLRDSGQIEQDADAVLFLYRPEYYLRQDEPQANDPERPEWERALADCHGRIEFICAKHRNGESGSAEGSFHGAYQAVRS